MSIEEALKNTAHGKSGSYVPQILIQTGLDILTLRKEVKVLNSQGKVYFREGLNGVLLFWNEKSDF